MHHSLLVGSRARRTAVAALAGAALVIAAPVALAERGDRPARADGTAAGATNTDGDRALLDALPSISVTAGRKIG